MAGSGNRVEINISANDNTAAGVDAATAKMKSLQSATVKIQADLDADKLSAQVNAAAAKARAKVYFDADLDNAAKLETEADQAAAAAKAKIKYESAIDAADLKAKADAAAAAAKAEIKFKAAVDSSSMSSVKADLDSEGDQAGQSFFKSFSNAFSSLADTPWMGIAISAAIVVGTPLAAGAMAGAASAMMIGLGAYMQRDSAPVQVALSNLESTFTSTFTNLSKPMVGPISDALNSVSALINSNAGDFETMFSDAAGDIKPLVDGIESLVTNAMPGLTDMMQHSGPIVSALGKLFGSVGQGLGDVFTDIANDAPEIGDDIKYFGDALDGVLQTVGIFTQALAKLGEVFGPILAGIANLVPKMVNSISEGFSGNGIGDAIGLDKIPAAFNAAAAKSIAAWTAGFNIGGSSGPAKAVDSLVNQMESVLSAPMTFHIGGDMGDLNAMSAAMKTFGDTTQTTQSRVQAFQQILAGFGQSGQQQVNSFIAAATIDLDSFANAFTNIKGNALNADGSIDQFSQKGATLQQQMVTAQQDIGGVAASMHSMGDSSDVVNGKITTLDNNLEGQLMSSLKLTKSQADAVISEFGLWPSQLDTHIAVTTNAADAMAAAQNAMEATIRWGDSQLITLHVATAGTNGPSSKLAFGGPMTHHALGSPIAGSALAMVNEMGPEIIQAPNGSRVIPNANVASELRGAGGGGPTSTTVTFAGDLDSAMATAFIKLIRANKIQIKQSQIIPGR